MREDSVFMRFWKNLIFPRRCVFCRRHLPLSAEIGVCTECMKALPFCLAHNRCKKCGRPISDGKQDCSHCSGRWRYSFGRISAAYLYQDSARRALLGFKRERNQNFAPVFAEHMAAVLRQDYPELPFDIVVAVPPRKARMQRDGYDQAEHLARTLAKVLELPFRPGVLRQVEKRKKQSDLSYEERWRNVRGNFRVVREDAVLEQRILLVDDICTTGAALNECAKVLGNAGARLVSSAVAAMVAEE